MNSHNALELVLPSLQRAVLFTATKTEVELPPIFCSLTYAACGPNFQIVVLSTELRAVVNISTLAVEQCMCTSCSPHQAMLVSTVLLLGPNKVFNNELPLGNDIIILPFSFIRRTRTTHYFQTNGSWWNFNHSIYYWKKMLQKWLRYFSHGKFSVLNYRKWWVKFCRN